MGDPLERLKDHLISIDEWSEEQHSSLYEELTKTVKKVVTEGEAIGTLGESKPSVKEMFDGVFSEPDWRVMEQRSEIGV